MKELDNLNYSTMICKDFGTILFFAKNDIGTNKNTLINLIKKDFTAFLIANDTLKQDFYFTLDCIKYSAQVAKYVDDCLIKNRKWVELAVKVNATSFCYLAKRDNKICEDIKICLYASQHIQNLKLFSATLLNNFNFITLVIQQNPLCIVDILKNNKMLSIQQKNFLALEAIRLNAYIYKLLPKEITTKSQFLQQAVMENPLIKQYLPKQNNQFNLKISKSL